MGLISDGDLDKAELIMKDLLERQEFIVPENMIALKNAFADGLLDGWRKSQGESPTILRQFTAGFFEEFVSENMFVSEDITQILILIAGFGKGLGTIIGALKYSVLNVLSGAKAVDSYAKFINKLRNERPEFYVIVIDVAIRWKAKIIRSHLDSLNPEQRKNYNTFITQIGIQTK